MKKSLLLLSIALLLGMTSCGPAVAPVVSSDEGTTSQAGSETTSVTPVKGDENWVDYAANGPVKLGLDYTGRNFFVDGIEQVTLLSKIDGDTAHFTGVNSKETIKSRFFGIDTPESTGKVQPYGKKASHFTGDVLDRAAANGTIVVSSANLDYAVPNPDSTGSRYVSLIWVNETKKNAAFSELKLLNLMIVQEGLSWVKTVTDMPSYVDTFYAAEAQAKAYKLMLHSGLPDDEFNYGDYESVSLLDLKQEMVACIKDPKRENKFDNKKVRLQGTVSGFAEHIMYLSDWCWYTDEEGNPRDDSKMEIGVTGEYASVNVFCGMSAISSKFKTLGNYVEICGLALDSQFGFQITDVELPSIPFTDTDGRVILKASENTEEHALHVFEYTKAEINKAMKDKDFNALNCRVSITEPLTVKSAKMNTAGDAMTIKFEGVNFTCYYGFDSFHYRPYPDDPSVIWNKPENFVGKTFLLSGVYAVHTYDDGGFTMNIYPSNSSDMVLQKA